MNMGDVAVVVVSINAGALTAVAIVGYKIIRHMARMELKVETLWAQFLNAFKGPV